MTKKWVYLFNEVDQAEAYAGSWDGVRGLLGGKGANLGDMSRAGVPVPPGLTITTEACNAFQGNREFPEGLWDQVLAALKSVEERAGKKFGDTKNPLLVSCRSGAKFSMPGMMDTVLNIGLNDEVAKGLVVKSGDERFVNDSYRRLIHMLGTVVMGIDDEHFEEPLKAYKEKKGYKSDMDMTAADWAAITEVYKKVVREHMGFEFPQDPYKQLELAVKAVFDSWNSKRAIDYRRRENIPDDLGTAVNVQTMVFGNMGGDSGTGVAFTRDPQTGENVMFGEYLMNAQGEDVVAGIRNASKIVGMKEELPEVYAQFLNITERLEQHYQDMQDVEFTIEHGKLWMLQTRNGKRSAKAAIKIAHDMVQEGLIDKKAALKRVTPEQIDQMLHPQFTHADMEKAREEGRYYAKGVNASPGAAVGQIYFDADTTEKMYKTEKQDVIMVRPFTKPDDVHGMLAAKGILTSEGGATSHAAVVARQFGVPCVVGAADIQIDMNLRQMTCHGITVKEGDWISLDGTTGEVFVGKLALTTPDLAEQKELMTLLGWADEISRLQVWANADYPADAKRARSYGAKGIGLCRTEHMFFDVQRLPDVQSMIMNAEGTQRMLNSLEQLEKADATGRLDGYALSDKEKESLKTELAAQREKVESSAEYKAYFSALEKILPLQRADFYGLFVAMTGLPVIIRLIDPPLHEFLPSLEDLLTEVATMRAKGIKEGLAEKQHMLEVVQGLHESNPMMGLRGIRLGIVYPDIMKMQVRAIFEAACDAKLNGFDPHPEVMIPLTGHVNELKQVQPTLVQIAKDVMAEKGVELSYKFGTMIEIPRAAATASEIAKYAEFFSFGTNDLTQMTFGYSRDDAERTFLGAYVSNGILEKNPFQQLDRDGVGRLMKMAVDEGRAVRPNLEIGICGEHGGDPSSIEFCHMIGNNYVSCSPFRVPLARLAAAHAALKHG
ncbi:MAG TPA: pyruvate, phosphate dikinase [Anaerolineaceae bacterium]|jgi:pyruvate,orthophosphate dikinase|nr:pyruvate, phosphate dikinase [Anaerolineaceae bacterium]